MIFVTVNYLFTGNFLPTTETKDIWFFSGLFMVLFSTLFIEPYYSSPKNVITNCIPLLLVFLSIRDSFSSEPMWYLMFSLISVLVVFSVIAMALSDENVSSEANRNKVANWLKLITVTLGQGKVIYSIVFLCVLFLYKIELIDTVSDSYFFALIIMWGCLLLVSTRSLHNKFHTIQSIKDENALGEVFSVQSNKMYFVKLFEDKTNIRKFDIVEFRYQMDGAMLNQGFIFDLYSLNTEKWAKVLMIKQTRITESGYRKNTVYQIKDREQEEALELALNTPGFIGVVIEGSTIGRIKFEYSKKENDLQEGDLIELNIGETRIFYQIVGGITNSEKLENKNESGFIEGEAIQLGIWDNISLSFDKYGWVPEINIPLFKADTENIIVPPFSLPEYQLGIIPNTKLPSVINLDQAVSHHLALLGVTGAGKSFLAKEIIDKLRTNTKVICVDFTGEWKKQIELEPLNSQNLDTFLTAQDNRIGLVELPTVSNTVQVIESTERFISAVFTKAKEAYEANSPMKICLILEEAHTIVPESSFLGVNDFSSKAVVNKMGQVALQGRKYGVGLMVIAQRTANVSKTVLTQCNTIICFQAFDETSFTFLGNYIGKDLVQALPNLKKYHAVVTGKAIKSNIPMIINLERGHQVQVANAPSVTPLIQE